MPRTPLLDASDRVSLADCAVAGDLLVDRLTGDRHALNPTAVEALGRFDGRHTLAEVALDQARRHHIDRADAARDLRSFVGSLEAAGLVRVRRRWRSWLHPAAVLARVGDAAAATSTMGADRSAPTLTIRRRYRPSVRGCAAASVWAARSLLLAGAASSVLALVAVAHLAPGAALAVALAPLILVLVAVATVAAHEAGHLLAARRVGGRPAFVAATTNQVAVIHDVTDPNPRRWVATAGPAAGATLALLSWPVLAYLPPPIDGLTRPAAVLLIAGHLASLLPWFADGRHVWGAGR